MTGAMTRDPSGPGPAETRIVLRTLRTDLADLFDYARSYGLTDQEIRDLVEEVLDPPPLCAGPADWRRQIDEEPCDGFASPGSDFCPSHDPDLL